MKYLEAGSHQPHTALANVALRFKKIHFIAQSCAFDLRLSSHRRHFKWSYSVPILTTAMTFIAWLFSPVALALPTGWKVVSGNVVFKEQGKTLTVSSSSLRAIVDYRNFNIGLGETVNHTFLFPHSSILDRILGGQQTIIAGSLKSNGAVLLVNPAGVRFTNTANVNVGSLLASTHNLSNNAYLSGDYVFTRDSATDSSAIENQGSITTDAHGSVVLVGSAIRNSGVINSPIVKLAVGERVTVNMSPHVELKVTIDQALKDKVSNYQTAIENSGVINARQAEIKAELGSYLYKQGINNSGKIEANAVHQQSGSVHLIAHSESQDAVVNNSGVISANGNDINPHGGDVRLEGDTAVNPGTLLATGTDQGSGGTIEMLGNTVENRGGLINASGGQGGGTALVGGDYQGANPLVRNAKYNTMDSDSRILANADIQGKGGKVVLWSDQKTVFQGNIQAKGGPQGGDGGLVETSGKTLLAGKTARVNASAPKNKGGLWLLDPTNLTISPGTGTDAPSQVFASNIQSTLNMGTDVTAQTSAAGLESGDITVLAGVNIQKTAGGDATLRLNAHQSILFTGTGVNKITIASSTNRLNLILNANFDGDASNGAISMSNANINTNGGNIVLGGGANPLTTAAQGTAANVTGIALDTSTLNAGTGNISLRGRGRDAAGIANLIGVSLGAAQLITSTGNIDVTGTGGAGSFNNYGVFLNGANSRITSQGGILNVTGQGGSATSVNNYGLYLLSGGQITSTGNATLNLSGTGGTGLSGLYGVFLSGANSLITSLNGPVTTTARGGNGTGSGNYGLYLLNGGQFTSTGNATLNLSGTGGTGSSSAFGTNLNGTNSLITSLNGAVTVTGQGGSGGFSNTGVNLLNSGQITSTGNATLNISGTGGTGSSLDHGVNLTGANARITSLNGAVTVTGQGTGTGSSNDGVFLDTGGQITSTGSATLNVSGTGGTGSSSNIGVFVKNTSSTISSQSSAVTVTGVGNGSGSDNYGVDLFGGGQITSVDNATLNISGTGGNGTSNNYGVLATGINSRITSLNGGVTVTGTGKGNGTGTGNRGVSLNSGGQITSTGSAPLSISGTGGSGTSDNYGIYLSDSTTKITGMNGDVTLLGQGGNGSSSGNIGVYLFTTGQINSLGSAKLNISGTGGTGTNSNHGVAINNALITSQNGDVTILGRGGVASSFSNHGISLSNSGQITSTGNAALKLTGFKGSNSSNAIDTVGGSNSIGSNAMTGDISLTNDSLSLNNTRLRTSGSITIKPSGDATSIGVNGGNGTLPIGTGTLNTIDSSVVTPSKLIIGNAVSGTGAVSIGSPWNLSVYNFPVEVYGGSIITGSINTGTNRLLLRALTGDITLNSGTVISSTATGNALILATDHDFFNNAGSSALSTPNGRWLTYAANPETSTEGGLSYGKFYNRTYTGNPPASIMETGNLFLYSIAPTLTITTDNLLKTYGNVNPILTGTVSGFIDGDTLASATSGSASFSTSVTQSSNVGTYNIDGTIGTMTSSLGYHINVVTPGTLTVNPAPLSVTANDVFRLYGSVNPTFSAHYSGFVLGQDQSVLGGSLALATPATQSSNAGNYAITPSGLTSSNYALSFNPGTLSVAQAPLSVTANDASRLYGAVNPAFSASFNGFVLGQDQSVLGGSLAFATPATQSSTVGEYAINPSGLTSSNYAISFHPGTLSVAQAPLSVTANDASRLYGAVNPAFSASFNGFVLGQDQSVLGGSLALATPATQSSNVGNYTITPSGLTSSNYAISFHPGTLSVAQAPLSVTANDASRLFGVVNPPFSASFNGFVLGQDQSVLGGTLTFSTPATQFSTVGEYAINPSGLTSSNYALVFIPGTLSILPLPPPLPPVGALLQGPPSSNSNVGFTKATLPNQSNISSLPLNYLGIEEPSGHSFLIHYPQNCSPVLGKAGGNDCILVLDGPKHEVVAEIIVGKHPIDSVITKDGKTAYILNQGDGTVSVVSLDQFKVTETIPVGEKPTNLTISADQKYLYIFRATDKRVTTIDLFHNSVLGAE